MPEIRHPQLMVDGHNITHAVTRYQLTQDAGHPPVLEVALSPDSLPRRTDLVETTRPYAQVRVDEGTHKALLALGWSPPAREPHGAVLADAPTDDEVRDVIGCGCGAKPGEDDAGRAWFADHLKETGAPDYLVGYWSFWAGLVEPSGVLSRDLVARELADYTVVMEEASKVYDELAGFSKPNTAAHHVIEHADHRSNEKQAALILHDLLPLIEGDENRQAVIDYAATLDADAWEDHQRSKPPSTA